MNSDNEGHITRFRKIKVLSGKHKNSLFVGNAVQFRTTYSKGMTLFFLLFYVIGYHWIKVCQAYMIASLHPYVKGRASLRSCLKRLYFFLSQATF